MKNLLFEFSLKALYFLLSRSRPTSITGTQVCGIESAVMSDDKGNSPLCNIRAPMVTSKHKFGSFDRGGTN